MSIPWCFSTPTLRSIKSSVGFVTLERIAPQHYKVWKEGVLIGQIQKYSHWFCQPERQKKLIDHKGASRKDCVEWLVDWHRRFPTPNVK